MPSVITVTLNPCIDKSTTIPAMVPDKKLRCSEPVHEPGGGGINVARAIRKLGGEAEALYFAGGYHGSLLGKLLEEEGVNYRGIPIEKDTRENIIVVDKTTGLQYRLGMPGPKISESEIASLLEAIEQEDDLGYIVVSGSLPPGFPMDIFKRLAAVAKKKNARLIVDTSGEALRAAIEAGVYMIKPNAAELASLADEEEMSAESIEKSARQLIANGSCEVIVVSMGAAGAMLITEKEAVTATAPPIKKRSTVGAGDSMVAGMITGLMRGYNWTDVLRLGVAAGSAATMNNGTELCKKEDTERLFRIIHSYQE